MIIWDKKAKREVSSIPKEVTAEDLTSFVGKKFPVTETEDYIEIDDSNLSAQDIIKVRTRLNSP